MKDKIIQTKYGKVVGTEKEGVTVFKGIPYARPPVGDFRWREPQKPLPWKDIRICDRFGCIPCQPSGWVGIKALMENRQSEDCLYLNIWTAAESKSSELPVLVWIHGGGFQGGCAHEDLYDGMEFAKNNIIVVSVSYRLSVFGFLAHEGFAEESPYHTSGNYGILDQIEALKWIRENIAEFGGNPRNVTVMGQSAGGMSVGCLMASPLAKGLFHKAIIQSGGPWRNRCPDFGEMKAQCKLLMEKLRISNYGELRGADAQILTQTEMPNMSGGFPYQPIIDGVVLLEDTYVAFREGRVHQIPLIIGNTTDETVLSPLSGTDRETFEKSVAGYFKERTQKFHAIYQSEKDWKSAVKKAGKEFGFYNLQNLTGQMLHTYRAAVYRYVFGQPAVTETGAVLEAGHSSELFFVFNTLQCRETNISPSGVAIKIKNSEPDEKLSKAINGYWAGFAKTGIPSAEGCPEWKNTASESYMYFCGNELQMKRNKRGERQRLWH